MEKKGRYYTVYLSGKTTEILDKKVKEDKKFKPATFLRKIIEDRLLIGDWETLPFIDKDLVTNQHLILALLWEFIKDYTELSVNFSEINQKPIRKMDKNILNKATEKSNIILEKSRKNMNENVLRIKQKLKGNV